MPNQSRYTPENQLIDLFKQRGKAIDVKSHECVIHVGEPSNKVFLILSGGFVCQTYDLDADSFYTINFHTKKFHPIMTVLDSYYRDVVSKSQLKAFKRSAVLSLPKKVILSEMNTRPELKATYLQETIYALTVMNEFLTKRICLSTKKMYAYLCQECPEILEELPDKYIAEFMGVRPEWLSRIKKEMEQSLKPS